MHVLTGEGRAASELSGWPQRFLEPVSNKHQLQRATDLSLSAYFACACTLLALLGKSAGGVLDEVGHGMSLVREFRSQGNEKQKAEVGRMRMRRCGGSVGSGAGAEFPDEEILPPALRQFRLHSCSTMFHQMTNGLVQTA